MHAASGAVYYLVFQHCARVGYPHAVSCHRASISSSGAELMAVGAVDLHTHAHVLIGIPMQTNRHPHTPTQTHCMTISPESQCQHALAMKLAVCLYASLQRLVTLLAHNTTCMLEIPLCLHSLFLLPSSGLMLLCAVPWFVLMRVQRSLDRL